MCIRDRWSNNQNWGQNNSYGGSYFPNAGCLEDFNTGPVDGTWTLTVVDGQNNDVGNFNDYEIILKYFQTLPLNQYNPKNKIHQWMSATDIYLFIHSKHPNFKMDVRWIGRGLIQLGFERRRTNAAGKQFLVFAQS